MAILEGTLLPSITGKIGNVSIYHRNGKICVRTVGWTYKSPPTPAQVQQRTRWRAVSVFYRALRAAGLEKWWKNAHINETRNGYNLFIKHNIRAFTGEGVIRDFNRILLTIGQLEWPDGLTVTRLPGGRLLVEWKNRDFWPNNRPDDRLRVAFMRLETLYNVYVPEIGEFRRDAGKALIELPPDWADYPHCYCFFESAVSDEVSESRYFELM